MTVVKPVPTAPVDIATRLAATMRQLQISGLPRNYELIYEAYSGSNPDLTKELAALGNDPRQHDLDRLGRKYLAHQHEDALVADAQRQITHHIEQVLRLSAREQIVLKRYGKVLDDASRTMSETDALKVDIIQNFIKVLAAATNATRAENDAIVETMVESSSEIERVRGELDDYRRMAHTDSLTRLSNRRAFDEALDGIYENSRDVLYSALVIADIDLFKRVNDEFGHPVGDKLLTAIAQVLRAQVRKDALVARIGGEEFAIVLTGSSEEDALIVAERIRRCVEETPFVNRRTGSDYGAITLSLGVCMATDAAGPEDLYRKADFALYASKNAGRNRVTRYAPALEGASSNARMMYRAE